MDKRERLRIVRLHKEFERFEDVLCEKRNYSDMEVMLLFSIHKHHIDTERVLHRIRVTAERNDRL